MPLKLFDRKRRCLSAFLKQNEEISALSGFGSHTVAGTSWGRVLIFSTTNRAEWENEAQLDGLMEEEGRMAPVTQVCCTSALGLILLVVGDELTGLEMDHELSVNSFCSSGVSRIALNSHPLSDDPFCVQLAIAQKAHILIGTIASGQLSRDRKISTKEQQSRIVEIAFSGHCLCYATEAGAYLVQSMRGTKNSEPIKLFEAQSATVPRVIRAIGNEEFALNGVQGLIVFVNGQGVSYRPPISLGAECSPTVGLALKAPFLYVLDVQGKLSILSTFDDQLKQTLAFPGDEPPAHSSRSDYQLANVDGQLFVLPPHTDCLFELVSVPVLAQIEEQVQLQHLDEALEMIDENFANFCASASEEDILQLQRLRKSVAIAFLQRAEFAKGFDLLARFEADPREMLALVVEQHSQLLQTEMDGKWPRTAEQFPLVPLGTVKQYLAAINDQDWALPFKDVIESVLARIFIVEGELSYLDTLTGGSWNSRAFREWLASGQREPNCAAKLAFEQGASEEAFSVWRTMAERGADKGALKDCFQALFRVPSHSDIAAVLPWLVPLDAATCMDAVEALEGRVHSAEAAFSPSEVVRLFNANGALLLRYLDKRAFATTDGVPALLHDKLLQLYVHSVRTEGTHRLKLRHFLLFSDRYDAAAARAQFANDPHFRVEAIFADANPETAIDCLRTLIRMLESEKEAVDGGDCLAAAELLCTRYPSAQMLKTMLTLCLRLSTQDPALREHIPHILSLLDNDSDVADVFQSVPSDLRSSALVRSFLRRHAAHQLNVAGRLAMRARLVQCEKTRLTRELAQCTSRTSFRVDEQTTCVICGRRLSAGEQFVRNPVGGRLSHLRCHEAKKGRVLL